MPPRARSARAVGAAHVGEAARGWIDPARSGTTTARCTSCTRWRIAAPGSSQRADVAPLECRRASRARRKIGSCSTVRRIIRQSRVRSSTSATATTTSSRRRAESPNGWQTVLRARNDYGPYEDRIVLAQGTTDDQRPTSRRVGQHTERRGLVRSLSGSRRVRAHRASPTLRWRDGWPVMGGYRRRRHRESGDVHPRPAGVGRADATPSRPRMTFLRASSGSSGNGRRIRRRSGRRSRRGPAIYGSLHSRRAATCGPRRRCCSRSSRRNTSSRRRRSTSPISPVTRRLASSCSEWTTRSYGRERLRMAADRAGRLPRRRPEWGRNRRGNRTRRRAD